MSIYKKISKMSGNESYEEKLYKLLNTPKYNTNIYETRQAGEGMAVINECIWGWWKPRFILNHNTKCAYEFMGCPKPVAASAMTWRYLGNREEATHVRCPWPGWDYKTYTVEDLAVGQVRFDNGAIMQIETSFAAHVKENDVAEFSAMGTKGGCQFPTGEIFTDQNGTMVNVAPAYLDPAGDGWDALFARKLGNWVDGCLMGTELGASGEDGLNVQRILNGLYDSAALGGREVPIR